MSVLSFLSGFQRKISHAFKTWSQQCCLLHATLLRNDLFFLAIKITMMEPCAALNMLKKG